MDFLAIMQEKFRSYSRPKRRSNRGKYTLP